jgi:hypothetical protein
VWRVPLFMHIKDPICRFRKSMPLCYLGVATDGKNFRLENYNNIRFSIHSNTSIPHLSIFYLIPTGCALRVDLFIVVCLNVQSLIFHA